MNRPGSKTIRKILSTLIVFVFLFTSIMPSGVSAQVMVHSVLDLPVPGTMLALSEAYIPCLIEGITVHPDNPLEFNFILDTGNDRIGQEELKKESKRLIKYFLSTLTVPESQLWVNLSPYEKDRIISETFGQTEMGRDMLAQDYLLKQLSASLLYPEDDLGQKFWDRVYKKAHDLYGTTEIPLNTFNKVWILPKRAVVYEHGSSAFVVESELKVMLEEDYLAVRKNMDNQDLGTNLLQDEDVEVISGVTSEVVRDVLIPELEREVNRGKTFANLRQIYNSMILATWYKRNLKETLLSKIYVDKNKINGVDIDDKQVKEKIYQQYLAALKKGVFDYIKEDYDPYTDESIPRKYFSGGITMGFAFGENRKFETVQSLGRDQRQALAGVGTKFNELVQLVETAPAQQVYDLQEGSIDEFKEWIIFNQNVGFVTPQQVNRGNFSKNARANASIQEVLSRLVEVSQSGPTAEVRDMASRVLAIANGLLDGKLAEAKFGPPAIWDIQVDQKQEAELLKVMGIKALPKVDESDNGLYIYNWSAENFLHALLAFSGLTHPEATAFTRVVFSLRDGADLEQELTNPAEQEWFENELRGPHDAWLAKYDFKATFLRALAKINNNLSGTETQISRPATLLAGLSKEESIETRRDYMAEPETGFKSQPQVRARVEEAMGQYFNPDSGVKEEKRLRDFLVSQGEQGIHEFAHAIMEDRGITEEEFGHYYVPPTTTDVDKFKGETAWGVMGEEYLMPSGRATFEKERLELMADVAIQRALGRRIISTVGIGHVATAMITVTAKAEKDFGNEELAVVHNSNAKYRRPLKGEQHPYYMIGYERVDINIGRMFDLNRGLSPVKTEDVTVTREIQAAFERGNIRGTFLPEVMSVADMLIVDTEVHLEKRDRALADSDPDLRATRGLMKQIGQLANKNTTIMVESTTFPGFTRNESFPAIEAEFRKRGLLGDNEHAKVGYAPQTMQPGSKWILSLMSIARKGSGMTEAAKMDIDEYFSTVGFKYSIVDKPETAELMKTMDNAYFYSLMEIMNAFMDAAEEMGLNGFEIAEAIQEARPQDRPEIFKRIAQMEVGGYCIPKDMGFIIQALKRYFGMEELTVMQMFQSRLVASNLSDHRAEKVINKHLIEALIKRGIPSEGVNLGILGVAYKGEISDTRWTGSQRLAVWAAHHGMHVEATDPYAVRWPQIQESRPGDVLDWSWGKQGQVALSDLQVDYQEEDGGYLNFIDPSHDALVWATPHAQYYGRGKPVERRQVTDSEGNKTTYKGASPAEIAARMLGLEGRTLVDTYDYFTDEETKVFLALGWDVQAYGKGNQKFLLKELTPEEKIAAVDGLIRELERLDSDAISAEKVSKGKKWNRAWVTEALAVQRAKLAYLKAQQAGREAQEVRYLEAKYESLKTRQELRFAKESEQPALEVKNRYHEEVVRGIELQRDGLTPAARQSYARAKQLIEEYQGYYEAQHIAAVDKLVETAVLPHRAEIMAKLKETAKLAQAMATAVDSGALDVPEMQEEERDWDKIGRAVRQKAAGHHYVLQELADMLANLDRMFEGLLSPEERQRTIAQIKELNRRPHLAISGRSSKTGEVDITQMTEAEKARGWIIKIEDRPYKIGDDEAEAEDKKRIGKLKEEGIFVIYRDTVTDPETGEMLEFVPFVEYVQDENGKLVKREDQQGFSRARTIKWRKDATGGKHKDINPLYSKYMVRVPLRAVRVANDMTILLHQGRIELDGDKTYSFSYKGKVYEAVVKEGVIEEIRDETGTVVTDEFTISESKNTRFIHPKEVETSELGRIEFKDGRVSTLTLKNQYVVYMDGDRVAEIRDFKDRVITPQVDIQQSGGTLSFRTVETDEFLGEVIVSDGRVSRIHFGDGYRAVIDGARLRKMEDEKGDDTSKFFEFKKITGHQPELYEQFDSLPYEFRTWMIRDILSRDRLLSTVQGEVIDRYYLLMDVNLDTHTVARGRGGIVMDAETHEPVVITTDQGAEQPLMMKAVGSYQSMDPRDLKVDKRRIIRGGRVEHEQVTVEVDGKKVEMVEMHNGHVIEFPLVNGDRAFLFEHDIQGIKDAKEKDVSSNYNIKPTRGGYRIETTSGEEVGHIKWGQKKQAEFTLGAKHKVFLNRDGEIEAVEEAAEAAGQAIRFEGQDHVRTVVVKVTRVSKSRFGQIPGHTREAAPHEVLKQQGTKAYQEGRTSRAPYRHVFTYYANPYSEEFQQLWRTVPATSRIGWELLGPDQEGRDDDYDPVEMTRAMGRMQAQILGQPVASVHIAPNPDNIYKRGIWFTDEDSQIALYNERDPMAAYSYYLGYYMALTYWDYQGSTNNDYNRVDLQHFHHWVNAFTRYLLDMKYGGLPVIRNPEKFERFLNLQPGDVTKDNLREFENDFIETVWNEYAAHHVLKNRLKYGYDPSMDGTFSTKEEYKFDAADRRKAEAFIDNQEKLLRAAERLVREQGYDILYAGGRPFDFEDAYAQLAAKREAIEIQSRKKGDLPNRYIGIYDLKFYKPLQPNVFSVLDYDALRTGVANLRLIIRKSLPTKLKEKVHVKLQEQLSGTEGRMRSLIFDGQEFQEEWLDMGFIPAYFDTWFKGEGETEITTIADESPEEVYALMRDDYMLTRQTLRSLSQLGVVIFPADPIRTENELYFYYDRGGRRFYVKVDLKARETHLIAAGDFQDGTGTQPTGPSGDGGRGGSPFDFGFGGGADYTTTSQAKAPEIAGNGWQTAHALRHIAASPDSLQISSADGFDTYRSRLAGFLLSLINAQKGDAVNVAIRSNDNDSMGITKIVKVTRQQVAQLAESDEISQAIIGLQQGGTNVLVQPHVGNVRIQTEDQQHSFILRVQTDFTYPGRYRSQKPVVVDALGNTHEVDQVQSNFVTTEDVLAADAQWTAVALESTDLADIRQEARRALYGLNTGLAPQDQIKSASVDIAMEIDTQGNKHFWVVGIKDLVTAQAIAPGAIPAAVMDNIEHVRDESHVALFKGVTDFSVYQETVDALRKYLRRTDIEADPMLYIKQERAIIVLADVIWSLAVNQPGQLGQLNIDGMVSDITPNADSRDSLTQTLSALKASPESLNDDRYLAYIQPFIDASYERELQDFERAKAALMADVPQPAAGTLKYQKTQGDRTIHESHGPMRFGISSGNGSDNWTTVKDRGGVTLNGAINLDGKVPVKVEFAEAQAGQIVLEIIGGLPGSPHQLILTKDNIDQFYTWENGADPFRMLKYALIFTGIVKNNPGNPSQVLEDVSNFTNGQGLHLRVTSFGPSRGGLASSTAVAEKILDALYHATGQDQLAENKSLRGSLAILMENHLRLKSGRQDPDGSIWGGIKSFVYPPTEGFVEATGDNVSVLDLNAEQLAQVSDNLIFVNTNIPRSSATSLMRNLSMRNLSYLSRDIDRGFDAHIRSQGIHQRIVQAFETQNWAALGPLFLEYMSYRERIDPNATWSIFDEIAGEKVLRWIYDPLVEQGLIYGGMFTGQMGGGVAMLVLTPKGKDVLPDGRRRIDAALEELKDRPIPDGRKPYENLEQINYSVNSTGTEYTTRKGLLPSLEEAVHDYEDGMKPRGYRRIEREIRVGNQNIPIIDSQVVDSHHIAPPAVVSYEGGKMPGSDIIEASEEELRSGRVGVISVAGGMKSRAGLSYPEGEHSLTPVSGKGLFEVMAEELLAAREKYGKEIPWFIMTSELNDKMIRQYFAEHDYFGLGEDNVIFMVQGSIPALDSETGQQAMRDETNLLRTPNGHGGVYAAMQEQTARTGGGRFRQKSALEEARDRGIKNFIYTQMQNPLPAVNLTALGEHVRQDSEFTTIVVKGDQPEDTKRGRHVKDTVTGKHFVAEYNQPVAKFIQGKPGFEHVHMGRHIISMDFMARAQQPPFHMVRNKRAQVYKGGQQQEGLIDKFESFVFDALHQAKRVAYVALDRILCCATFKEMTGPTSPGSVSMVMSDLHKLWLRQQNPTVQISDESTLELSHAMHVRAGSQSFHVRDNFHLTGNAVMYIGGRTVTLGQNARVEGRLFVDFEDPFDGSFTLGDNVFISKGLNVAIRVAKGQNVVLRSENIHQFALPEQTDASAAQAIEQAQRPHDLMPYLAQPGEIGLRAQKAYDEMMGKESRRPGGIDFNPAHLDLIIKRDENNVPLPVHEQPIPNIQIDGFVPVIIEIVPVTNFNILLGLSDDDNPYQIEDQLSYHQDFPCEEIRQRYLDRKKVFVYEV